MVRRHVSFPLLFPSVSLAACCLAVVPARAAETIVFDGSNLGLLGTGPIWNVLDSLFPAVSLTNNTVTVTGGVIAGDVYGGITADASDVTNNNLTVTGGQVVGDVLGGVSSSGNVFGNSVGATGNSIGGNFYGGYSVNANAFSNGVNLGDSTSAIYNVYGGLSEGGNAYDNRVILNSNVSVGMNVYGGYSVNGNAYDNSLSISGNASVSQNVFGGLSNADGEAFGNSVSISGGSVTGTVAGGYSLRGDVSGNSVTIGGGSMTGVVYGGASDGSGDVSANSVSMTGGSLSNGVLGGASADGNASGNSVSITGGSVDGIVYGGFSPNGNAIDNTVTIGSGTVFFATSALFGGFTNTGDAFTGNTLNVKTAGLTVQGLYNFQNLNFYLPSTLAAGGTVLTVTGEARLSENADGSGRQATVNVGIQGGSSPLKAGDRIVLIDAGTLTGTSANTTTRGQGMQGVSLLYEFDLQTLNDQLLATVASTPPTDPTGPTGPTVNPQTKALSEGRVAGLAFANQGANMVVDQGMVNALAATRASTDAGGRGKLVGFGAVSGGSSRYDTGSHVDVDGVSLMTGLAWRNPLSSGSLLLGAFFEAGWGNYDSYNSFSNAATVNGDGDTNYYGGGVLGRYELTEGKFKGLYTEASLRVGQSSLDFSSNDLRDYSGRRASYDSDTTYYGAHAGLGYVWQVNQKTSLDFSTKYLWTHQEGDAVTVVGDPIRFEASDSQRWRNGVRFSYAATERVTTYIGVAYEYEFDGKARATTYGYKIETPSLEGGTGIGALGISLKPVEGGGLSIDLAVQGYVGMREGVTGSLQVKYTF